MYIFKVYTHTHIHLREACHLSYHDNAPHKIHGYPTKKNQFSLKD